MASEAHRTQAGRFIVATNILDQTNCSAEAVVVEYKDQTCERGFRFLCALADVAKGYPLSIGKAIAIIV